MTKRNLILLVLAVLMLCASPALAAKKKAMMDPINSDYAKGVQAVNERHWNAGIELLTKVIDNPATPKELVPLALTNRGTAYANKKMTAEALADLTKAIEHSKAGKPQAVYYKNRGLSYGAMTNLDAAKADFKKARELDPGIKIPMHYKPMLKQ